MKVLKIGISGIVLASLISCSSIGLGSKRVDYRSGAAQVPSLEVPPDLTAPGSDEHYRVPQGNGESVATFSDYSKEDTPVAQEDNTNEVLPADTNMTGTAAVASSVARINASGPSGTASMETIFDGSKIIVVNDAFDRSWRKVGLAIEHTGLTVDDMNRIKGVYFLHPAKAEKGWMDKLMFWQDDENTDRRYRVNIKDGGAACEVSVTDQDGANDETSGKILEAIFKNINE